MILRAKELNEVRILLKRHPVVSIIGARQVGKTTLARALLQGERNKIYLDLENPADDARLADPLLGLQDLRGLVVLDEAQRRPDLFPVLRVLADRPRKPARFLLLGSASPSLMAQSSETLAGRIAFFELTGFSIEDVGIAKHRDLWVKGGFPKSFLAGTLRQSDEWRRNFITTFLEKDLPQLGVKIPAATLRRFWTMVAHYHGQVWNSSEFARSFGVADTTIRNYLDVLTGALVLRQLPPWFENISKRQVKSPKVYIRDSGLLHTLLGQRALSDLEAHPKVGASWEGFIIEQLIHHLGARPDECFFWATHSGAEIDLLVVRGRQRLGFEVKRTTAPALTASLRAAWESLNLSSIAVIHAGRSSFPLAKGVRAVSIEKLLEDIPRLK